MDLDLDNDVVFENDRIRDFLQDKFQEIEVSNKNLQEMIKKRKDIFLCISETSNKDVQDVEVTFSWKKIFNGQCAFGYQVHEASDINLNLCKVIMRWDSSELLHFCTHIVNEKNLICSERSNEIPDTKTFTKSFIVIVIKLPQFLDSLIYTLKGSIFHKQSGVDIIVDLPVVEITSSDLFNIDLKIVSVETGCTFDLFTVILCSLKTDLVMILPENSRINLSSLLEIDCYLTSVKLPELSKKYFTAYNICPSFNNSLIEIAPSYKTLIYSFIVFTKDHQTLEVFLHFLHQNIPGVLIIPKSCLQYYDIEKIARIFDKMSEIDKFKCLLEKEIGIVNSYKHYLDSARIDCDICLHLRRKLLDAEKNTDLSYLRIISDT